MFVQKICNSNDLNSIRNRTKKTSL